MSGIFIQSKFGSVGNFEVVVTSFSGPGLVHYWRNNDDSGLPWSGPTRFGADLGYADGVSLIESNYAPTPLSPGNLEVVVTVGGSLYHFWRDSSLIWNRPIHVADGVNGTPGFIQSRFGTKGNFELVVPALGVGLYHYWRNNDDPSLPWRRTAPFAQSLGPVDTVSLIQSNYGNPGNLEVIATTPDLQAYYFWRDSGPSFTWNGPFPLSTISGLTISGWSALIQSGFGPQGNNFELVSSPPTGDGLLYYWKSNNNPTLPWSDPTPFGVDYDYGTPSLIESNYGSPGNLEMVTQTSSGDTDTVWCAHFYRDSFAPFTWHGPFVFGTEAIASASRAASRLSKPLPSPVRSARA